MDGRWGHLEVALHVALGAESRMQEPKPLSVDGSRQEVGFAENPHAVESIGLRQSGAPMVSASAHGPEILRVIARRLFLRASGDGKSDILWQNTDGSLDLGDGWEHPDRGRVGRQSRAELARRREYGGPTSCGRTPVGFGKWMAPPGRGGPVLPSLSPRWRADLILYTREPPFGEWVHRAAAGSSGGGTTNRAAGGRIGAAAMIDYRPTRPAKRCSPLCEPQAAAVVANAGASPWSRDAIHSQRRIKLLDDIFPRENFLRPDDRLKSVIFPSSSHSASAFRHGL